MEVLIGKARSSVPSIRFLEITYTGYFHSQPPYGCSSGKTSMGVRGEMKA